MRKHRVYGRRPAGTLEIAAFRGSYRRRPLSVPLSVINEALHAAAEPGVCAG